MPIFLTINGVFIVIFIAITLMHPPIWGWVLFIGTWCIADYFVIKKTNIHLKSWQWFTLITALTVIDFVVLYAAGQL
ncbi:MAG: hypothetical protein ACRBCK_11495 [Alphaproteobacteria bacterium]